MERARLDFDRYFEVVMEAGERHGTENEGPGPLETAYFYTPPW
ncbi:hypothetical protein [Haloarcula rubripromontorii]|nr:hypothetical protein [Haloarcula rubripromontorii]